MYSHRGRRGLTLIEVLVDLAILGVLFGLLVPAVVESREARRRVQCLNNLRRFGIAVSSYVDFYNVFPSGTAQIGDHGQSLHVRLLPQFELGAIYNAFNLSVFIGASTQNRTAYETPVAMFLCPSDPLATGVMTSYRGCLGAAPFPDGWGVLNFGTEPAEITDGMSQTVAMSESLVGRADAVERLRRVFQPTDAVKGPPANSVEFTTRCTGLVGEVPIPSTNLASLSGHFYYVSMSPFSTYNHTLPINRPSCANTKKSAKIGVYDGFSASSLHPGGVNCLFADGHVRFVRETVNVAAWRALATCAYGEVILSSAY